MIETSSDDFVDQEAVQRQEIIVQIGFQLADGLIIKVTNVLRFANSPFEFHVSKPNL